jgi:adenine deaminase
MKISGQLVDIHKREICPATITIAGEKIIKIDRLEVASDLFILPGLIDSHIHIESSMITPGAFGFTAVKHGTTGVVSDPHEIVNVMGREGLNFMLEDARKSPVRFWFGAPSCVPATDFETSGGMLGSKDIEEILEGEDFKYLSEMMNFPGVIYGDKEVAAKLTAARRNNKPVDGHAPGLSGEDLRKYVAAGISTDHECSTLEEALEKISLGMKILIREGSAAKNLDALKELYKLYPDKVMLCSDDLHPEMLVKGHINKLVARLISEGYDVFDVIRSATLNPVVHYTLNSGLLEEGGQADFIVVDRLEKMNVSETWIKGKRVFNSGKCDFFYPGSNAVNNFNCREIGLEDIAIKSRSEGMRVIEAFDGELLTGQFVESISEGIDIVSDTSKDILKIVVKDRYLDAPPAVGFIKGFGLKQGAFASSVAHDSHNIVAVGVSDSDLSDAINAVIRMKGGLAVSENGNLLTLKLDIGGIMTTRTCEDVARDYSNLSNTVKAYGCILAAPFMTLSFMALLVIPELKIGDRGLFDVRSFSPVSLFIDQD